MVNSSSGAGLSYQTFGNSQAQYLDLSVSPGIDYFFARNLAVGVDLSASYYDDQGYGSDGSLVETKTTGLAAGARLGVNVPLGRRVSIFPRVTVGLEFQRVEQSIVTGQTFSVPGNPVGYPTTTRTGPYAVLFVPVLLHLAPHFFIGVGPSLYRDFGSVQGGPNVGGERTRVELSTMVGGTWGGAAPVTPALAPEEAPPVRERQFGEAGEWVFDGELELQIAATVYDGTSSSNATSTLGPSFDYFATDHLSMGLAAYLTSSASVGVDAVTGGQVHATGSGQEVVPRIGYDVPFTPWLSWYPRVGMAFGASQTHEASSNGANDSTASIVAFEAFAPLLVHPAAHVFVGFGPSFDADLTRTVHYPNGAEIQNPGTTFGASTLIGGWL